MQRPRLFFTRVIPFLITSFLFARIGEEVDIVFHCDTQNHEEANFALKKVYDEIWENAQKHISAYDIVADGFWGPQNKKEHIIALNAIIAVDEKTQIKSALQQLQEIEPTQYYGNFSSLHTTITIFDLVRTLDENFRFDNEFIEKCRMVLRKALQETPSFMLYFQGLGATKGAVIAQGFGGTRVIGMRNNIKKACEEEGISLNEKYQTSLTHSTLIRFTHSLENKAQFLDQIEQWRAIDLDRTPVTKILLVIHRWYISETGEKKIGEEVLEEYPLIIP